MRQTSSSINVATTAISNTRLPHAIWLLRMGDFSHTAPCALTLPATIPCTNGPIEPQTPTRGSLATFCALSVGLKLRSPIMVSVLTTTEELTTPAAKRRTAQVTRSVAKPMDKQHMAMPNRPPRAMGFLPTRSAKYPQRMPTVPPKAYAQSRMLRRYDVDRLPQKSSFDMSIFSCGCKLEATMLKHHVSDD